MTITTRNILVIAMLSALLTIVPSIISNNAFSQTNTAGIPHVTGNSIKKPAPPAATEIQLDPSFTDPAHRGASILPNTGATTESDISGTECIDGSSDGS